MFTHSKKACFIAIDPAAAPVAGSVYNTLADAVGNFQAGDTWGDGNDDTILFSDGLHLISASGNYNEVPGPVGGASGTLTIRAAAGAQPIHVYGLHLPDEVLRKVYQDNARKVSHPPLVTDINYF